MATPRAARHRDLEQRLRDLEAQVQRLTSQSLRREQLGVSSGDFVVSGGGGVIIEDGGDFRTEYADGSPAVSVRDQSNGGHGLLVERDGGGRIMAAGGYTDAAYPEFEVWDKAGYRVIATDGASGKGLSKPDLSIPLYKTGSDFTTSDNAYTTAYSGDATHWQPRLHVRILTGVTAAGMACDARLQVNGTTIDTQSASGGGYLTLEGAIPSFTAGTSQAINVDIRRNGGTSSDKVSCVLIQCRGASS